SAMASSTTVGGGREFCHKPLDGRWEVRARAPARRSERELGRVRAAGQAAVEHPGGGWRLR
ncbi:MAG: hypothetical protein CMN31_16060, partial [Sandaracinus sp.]|nr:hypothetical protein [Sandaracinus sp.]